MLQWVANAIIIVMTINTTVFQLTTADESVDANRYHHNELAQAVTPN